MFIVNYHTPGYYAYEADRLKASLRHAGMGDVPQYIVCRNVSSVVPFSSVLADGEGGSRWEAATEYKARFILRCRDYLDGPFLWLDADAVVHEDMRERFERIEDEADIAVHYLLGSELLTGTLWVNDTEAAWDLLGAWVEMNTMRVADGKPHGCGQRNLADVLNPDTVRVERLEAEYCAIFDHERQRLEMDGPPIIEHLQASRVTHWKVPDARGKRTNRIREIEAGIASGTRC